MYVNDEVDLPEDLVSAQQDGELVVFAGAGVSMGSPSNLPSFDELARRVGGPSHPRMESERPDQFLGRIEMAGVDVQALTRREIDREDSSPTGLHRGLLRLFLDAGAVRLVTTNFDRHFTTVAATRFTEPPEAYYGPALPIGRAVRGIVYLHGGVEKPGCNLVLTDRDFGRAYLTDGWATRMLMEMFARWTVLFVGYSHGDTVMEYLARGLVPGTSRFALVPEGDEARWLRLGVTPVTYPLANGPDRHQAVTRAVADWTDLAMRGLVDHEDRIREITEGPPPIEPERADYMLTALRHPALARFFAQKADTLLWFEWAREHGAFQELADPNVDPGEATRVLARWLADRFAVEHPREVMDVVISPRGQIHPVLGREVFSRMCQEPRPPPEVLSSWITILVQQAPMAAWTFPPHALLESYRHPDDQNTILLLLQHFTLPRLKRRNPYPLAMLPTEERRTRVQGEIVIEVPHDFLRTAWKAVISPNIADFCHDVLSLCGVRIAEAHRLQRAAGFADSHFDPMSFRRSAIETHEQDRFPSGMDRVIDLARDALDWAVEHRPGLGSAVVHLWISADAPLLRRLGIHGLASDPKADPDALLRRVVDEEWLYSIPSKYEVFRLLRTAYPRARKDSREALLRHSTTAQVLPVPDPDDPEHLRVSEYARYNVAAWLARVAPECPLAESHLRRVQQKHPEFSPREHPDLDWTIGAVERIVPESPFSVKQLLEDPAPGWLPRILAFEEVGMGGPSVSGLKIAIQEAVKADPDWGMALAERAVSEGVWHPVVWHPVVGGWYVDALEATQWESVLRILSGQPDLLVVALEIARLLRDGLEAGSIPEGLLGITEKVADELMTHLHRGPQEMQDRSAGDWHAIAINHPVGALVEVWFHALARRRSAAGDHWVGLTDVDKERILRAIEAEPDARGFGRAVVGARAAFLYELESEWTADEVLPMFDWEANPRSAVQAWHGFLVMGRFTPALVERLLPFMEQSFSRLNGPLQVHQDTFCRRLAGLALSPQVHPLEQGWLRRFIKESDEEPRTTWVAEIGRHLTRSSDIQVTEIWQRWMREFWEGRLAGLPIPLRGQEATRTAAWALALRPVFSEAVELACQTPLELSEDDFDWYDWKEFDFEGIETDDFARLFKHVVSGTSSLTYRCRDAMAVATRLYERAPRASDLPHILDQLARHGCSGATELLRRLRGNAP